MAHTDEERSQYREESPVFVYFVIKTSELENGQRRDKKQMERDESVDELIDPFVASCLQRAEVPAPFPGYLLIHTSFLFSICSLSLLVFNHQ